MNARGWLNDNKRHGKLHVVHVHKQQALYMHYVLVTEALSGILICYFPDEKQAPGSQCQAL